MGRGSAGVLGGGASGLVLVVAGTSGPNSEVSPAASVAVAVMSSPSTVATGRTTTKLPVVVTVARLERSKGVDTVVRAVAATRTRPVLVVVGSLDGAPDGGKYAASLPSLAERLEVYRSERAG